MSLLLHTTTVNNIASIKTHSLNTTVKEVIGVQYSNEVFSTAMRCSVQQGVQYKVNIITYIFTSKHTDQMDMGLQYYRLLVLGNSSMLLAASQTSQPTRGKKQHSSCAEQVKTKICTLLHTTHVFRAIELTLENI